MELIVLPLAQSFIGGSLSGIRPAQVFALLQIYLYTLTKLHEHGIFPELIADAPVLPAGAEGIIHPVAIAAVIGWAVAEHFVLGNPDIAVIPQVKWGKTAVAALFAGLGPIMFGATGLAGNTYRFETAENVVWAAGVNGGLLAAAIVVSVFACTAASVLYGGLLEGLEAIDFPAKYLRRMESLGILGTVATILLIPFLSVILAALLLVLTAIVWFVVSSITKKIDARRRTQCPSCGHAVRKEAVLCPACQSDLTPEIAFAS